jgi:uncharacterized OB-fold protein
MGDYAIRSERGSVGRPLPHIDDLLYLDFFQSLRACRLVIRRCGQCSLLQWPPREICANCHSSSFEKAEVHPVGDVYTYTIVYRAFHPWFRERTPYAVLIADLGDGVRMLGNYWEPDVEEIECGIQVKATFEVVSTDVTLLRWLRA